MELREKAMQMARYHVARVWRDDRDGPGPLANREADYREAMVAALEWAAENCQDQCMCPELTAEAERLRTVKP